MAGLLGDRSEGRWWSVCLGICMGTAGDRTCPPVPPDTLEALAGADMACRRFECDIGFQCKTWSLSNLNICLHLFIYFFKNCLWIAKHYVSDCLGFGLVFIFGANGRFNLSTWRRPNPYWVLVILVSLLDQILFGSSASASSLNSGLPPGDWRLVPEVLSWFCRGYSQAPVSPWDTDRPGASSGHPTSNPSSQHHWWQQRSGILKWNPQKSIIRSNLRCYYFYSNLHINNQVLWDQSFFFFKIIATVL